MAYITHTMLGDGEELLEEAQEMAPIDPRKKRKEDRKKKNLKTGMTVGGGAAAGATIGLIAGPIGALIGAGIGAAGGGIYDLIAGKKAKKKAKKKEKQAFAAQQATIAQQKAAAKAAEEKEMAEKIQIRTAYNRVRTRAQDILRQLQQRLISLRPQTRRGQNDENYEDDFSQLEELLLSYKDEIEEVVNTAGSYFEDEDLDGLNDMYRQLGEIHQEANLRLAEYRPMYMQTNSLPALPMSGIMALPYSTPSSNMLGMGSCGAECDCGPCKDSNLDLLNYPAYHISSNMQVAPAGNVWGESLNSRVNRGLSGDDLGDWLSETRKQNRKALGLPPIRTGIGAFDMPDSNVGKLLVGIVATAAVVAVVNELM